MRVIVFDRELHEALTIVEVPMSLAREAMEGRRIYLATEPWLMSPRVYEAQQPPEPEPFKIVALSFEPVYRGASKELLFWFAYADNPELVLLLRAAFLPGQVSEVQQRERRAYVEGLFVGAGLGLQ